MIGRQADIQFWEGNDRHACSFCAYPPWSFASVLVISVQFLLYIRLEIGRFKAPLTCTPLSPYWSIRSVKLRDPDRFVGWHQKKPPSTTSFRQHARLKYQSNVSDHRVVSGCRLVHPIQGQEVGQK